MDLLAVPSVGSPSPSLVNNQSSSPPSPSGYIVTVGGQASPLTEHVPKLPGRSTSVLGNNAGTGAPAEAPIPSLQPEPAPSVLSQGQGIWAAADFPSSASIPPMASEDPFAQPETHAPASAPSLSSCASRPPTPSQDSESQQMPMAAVKSEMSQAESQPSATQRLERDELEMIQEFQRKHDIVVSRVQLEAVANLLRGVDVLSIWATGTGKSLVFQLVAHILQGLVVVLTPLKATIVSQLEECKVYGISASSWNAGASAPNMPPSGHVVYLTAEKLMMGDCLPYLQQKGPVLWVCDEAHQVVRSGASFCEVWTQVKQMRPPSSDTPMYTCTATATPRDTGVWDSQAKDGEWRRSEGPLLWLRTAAAQQRASRKSQSQSHCSL